MNMMDPDDQIRIHPQLHGPSKEQSIRFGCGCLIAIAAIVFLLSVITPYTHYLWFAHDARRPQVFAIAYTTRGLLFAFAFVPALLALYFSLSRSLSVSLVYLRIPETLGEVLLSNVLGWFRENAAKLTKLVSLALALFLALGFAGEWNTYLLATHVESFGRKDPTFGLDLGFFVFSLPWYLAICNFVLAVLFLTTALTIGVYVGMQMIASMAKIELSRPFVRMHLCTLIGLTILAFAAQLWLRRYEVGFSQGSLFTGAGFSGMQGLGAQTIAAVLFALVGVATIVNGRVWKAFRVPIVGGISAAAFYVVGVFVYPAIVQRFKVEPNMIQLEAPYAKRAIEATRFAYGLEQIEARNVEVHDRPTAQELADSQTTIENMRLWDPDVLQRTLDVIQTLRSYYMFNDVDIDRYMVDGKQTLMMVAPRDIYPEGLEPAARQWVPERLQYTHGFGVAMSPVNTADTEGLPTFLVKNIPPTTSPSAPELQIRQPRIYFSDFRDAQKNTVDEYAIVHSGMQEFDYPVNEKMMTTRWEGDRGIPFSGLLTRLAFSIVFQDVSPLVAGDNITARTKLLIHRSVIERARLIYPFLQFDNDPYIVVLNGELIWILDGYTTTGQIPYSARIPGADASLNYIRNSVKVTINAYSGETSGYAVDETDPILRAYRRIYPGLVSPASEMPAGLDKHLRYPEDMFNLQAVQLTQYHVQDPQTFLNNSQAWDMPYERGKSGSSEPTRPYYVQMRLPDEPREGFLLILPFTPRQKINMTGWLAAHCDPGNYGRLVLYQYAEGVNVPGPAQMESTFNQDKVIADINRQLNNDQSMLVPGNSLVVPLGKSLLYVEPLFLQSRSVGIPPKPKLVKVILALPTGNPVVADTYEEALQQLFGTPTAPQAPPAASAALTPTPAQPVAGVPKEAIKALAKLLEQAEAAQRNGDWARYGELQKQLKAKLQGLAK